MTDYSNLALASSHMLKDKSLLGLSVQSSTSVIFHKLEVAEVTGRGSSSVKPRYRFPITSPPCPAW